MKNFFEKLKNIYFLLPIILLVVAVYYPFVANMFVSNTELLDNRPLKSKPIKFSSTFSRDFEQYYNDTFAGRKKLIVKYVKLKQKLKIDTGQYFYGQDGWMFYDSAKINNGNSMLDYYASVLLDDEQLQQMRKGLEEEKKFYESYGAKYMLLVAPNKENIYSEYMPERMQKMRVSDFSVSDQGAQYLNEHQINVLNLKSVLLSSKPLYPYNLYYKKDTHWNAIGGYIGFYSLMEELKKMGAGGFLQPLTVNMISPNGLVGQDMHPTEKDMSYIIDYLQDRDFTKTEIHANKLIVYDNNNPISDKTIMLEGDSFAGMLLPYLAKNYRRVVNVAAGIKDLNFYKDVMREYHPDIVVRELVERYFRVLVNIGKLYERD